MHECTHHQACQPTVTLTLACKWLPAMPKSSLRSAEHVDILMSVLACPADQLQRATERQEYAEAAHLLEAVQQLAGHFQSYVQIPKVGPCGCSCMFHMSSLWVQQCACMSAPVWSWWCLDKCSNGSPAYVAMSGFEWRHEAQSKHLCYWADLVQAAGLCMCPLPCY